MMAQLSMLSLAPGPCTALRIIVTIVICILLIINIIFLVLINIMSIIMKTTPVKVTVDEKSRRRKVGFAQT